MSEESKYSQSWPWRRRPPDRVRIRGLSASHELPSWSWIAPDGKEVLGDEQELVSKLRKGDLPPSTLVWRRTWLEWIPALRVAELSSAFPKQNQPPIEPKRSPTAETPPARPGAAKLPRNPAALPSGGATPAATGTAPSSFGTIGRPRGPSVLGPPRGQAIDSASPPRAQMATLGDAPEQNRQTTLRPPGAIPPPPRAIPAPNFDLTPSRARDEEAATRRQNPTPQSPLKDTVRDARTPGPSSALPSELRPAVVIADLDATLGSTPFEVTARDFVDITPSAPENAETAPLGNSKTTPPARKKDRRQGKKPAWLGVVVLASAVGLTVFALVKLLTKSRTNTANAPTTAPLATTTATPATPTPTGCGIVQPAARLAAPFHRPVTPLLTAPADGTRASVGFAESETDAVGLTVDLVTLDVERVFRETKKKPVRFVVPLALDPKRFVVDRDDGDRPLTRSVDTEQRFGLGPLDKDWVRITGSSTGVLWSGQAADKTTDPHVASSAAGHLVTFRRGGLSGQVLYGFLGTDGSARGELRVVDAPGVRLSGTPDAALAGSTFVVAFAGRATQEDEWRIVLASGKMDGGPAVVRTFTSPPGGAGGSSIAPSVSGLGNDGFVLQWTEGKSAEYQVRVQRLSADLEPVGEPALVSPKGANAGQGAVFARAPRAISLFVQTTAGHDELWGTSLECP